MRSSRKPLVLALVLGAVIAVPAVAQSQAPASAYPPACEPSKVSKSDIERAHTVFLSGKQYLEESNYEKAISYFKDAYSIDCSIHAILPIIATAYERKGDRGEAVKALDEYQKRAPTAPDHEVIERRIRNLKDQLAREQAAASAPTVVAPPPPSASAAAPPPSANPAATAPAPGATGSPQVPPAATPAEAPPSPSMAPWIVMGAGGAVVVAGVILYAVGAGDVSSAEQACPGHQCKVGDTTNVSKGNDGRTMETVGAVLGAVGVGTVAAGLIWHFVSAPAPASAGAAHITPVVGLGGGDGYGGKFTGLSLSGTF